MKVESFGAAGRLLSRLPSPQLVEHPIRKLWHKRLPKFPDETCLGCGNQRFRLKAFKRIDRQIVFALKAKWNKLYWEHAAVPIFAESSKSREREDQELLQITGD